MMHKWLQISYFFDKIFSLCKLQEPYIYYGYPPTNQQLLRPKKPKYRVFEAIIVDNSVNSAN